MTKTQAKLLESRLVDVSAEADALRAKVAALEAQLAGVRTAIDLVRISPTNCWCDTGNSRPHTTACLALRRALAALSASAEAPTGPKPWPLPTEPHPDPECCDEWYCSNVFLSRHDRVGSGGTLLHFCKPLPERIVYNERTWCRTDKLTREGDAIYLEATNAE